MNPIKLYVGENYREPKLFTYTELLFPFWGVAAKESMPYVRAASLQYQYSKSDFTLVPRIEDADFVLIPYQYDRLKATNPERLRMIEAEAMQAKKGLLIDGAGDLEHSITVPNAVVLRVSQYQYSKQPNEVTVSFPAEDLLQRYAGGTLHVRKKSDKPSVGFTGWADISLTQRLKIYAKEWKVTVNALLDAKRGAEHKGLLFRARALKALSRNPNIEPRFTARKTYSGHVKTIVGSVEDTRKEFVQNLLNSDYALCVRGDANASVRFYEALSLGRIPLFLNTACVLPFEDKINYRDFCVFVDWKDTDSIDAKLLQFHQKVSGERFIQMQQQAREVYEKYLRMDAFSGHVALELRKRGQMFYTAATP